MNAEASLKFFLPQGPTFSIPPSSTPNADTYLVQPKDLAFEECGWKFDVPSDGGTFQWYTIDPKANEIDIALACHHLSDIYHPVDVLTLIEHGLARESFLAKPFEDLGWTKIGRGVMFCYSLPAGRFQTCRTIGPGAEVQREELLSRGVMWLLVKVKQS